MSGKEGVYIGILGGEDVDRCLGRRKCIQVSREEGWECI